jgi:thiol-disulfide isomerase/thioredoxin
LQVRLLSLIEGQAVRTAVGVALVAVCLGLCGCSLFGKKQAAQKTNPKPFLGSETTTKADTAAAPRNTSAPLPGADGTLAGRVVVEATEQPIRAYILLKKCGRDEDKAAPIDFSTDDSGYFFIPKLNTGEQYELVARAKDGGELISCTMFAIPPKNSMFIRLDKKFTTARTPPLPGAPTMPEKRNADSGEAKDHTPAASIGPPEKLPERNAPPRADLAAPTPASGSGNSPDNGNTVNPANIADGGFQRIQPPSVPADIPNRPPWPPPVPPETQWQKAPEEPQPRTVPAVPSAPSSAHVPNLPTPVPSCGLYGKHLDNLALRDLDGNVWEYKRDRRGRLLLLDFWYHTCGPCLQAIPHLCSLQRSYGPYGLEVVGIACETGSLDQQRKNVLATRGRYNINYKLLLSGGGPGQCPVMTQFGVEYFPTLILIDGEGTILWRSTRDGMDDREHYKLEKMISDRLVTRQAAP